MSQNGESARALAESGLLDRLPAAVYVAEPGAHGRWLYVNEAITDILGHAPGDFLDDPELWARLLDPRDREAVLDNEDRLAGGRLHTEYRMVRPDGRVVWVRDDAVLRDDVGERPVLHGLIFDITEQKTSARMVTVQAEIMAGAARGDALTDLLTTLGDHVLDLSGATACLIELQPDPSANRHALAVERKADRARDDVEEPVECSVRSPEGEVLGQVRLQTAADPEAGPRVLASWAARLVGMAAQRAAERARLQESVALREATLESTEDGILVVDAEGRTTGWNQKFAEMWRIDQEILQSRDDARMISYVLGQLVDPDGWVAKVMELYDSPTQTSFDEFEFLDGRVFERYSQPQVVDGESVGRVWSFRDVTDKRLLQKDLELLSSVATAANSATDVRAALVEALRAFCRYGGLPLGRGYLTDDDRPDVLLPAVWHEEEPGKFAEFRERLDRATCIERGLAVEVLRAGQPRTVTIDAHADDELLAAAAAADLTLVCAFPVIAGEETVGVLEFFAGRPLRHEDRVGRAMRQVGLQLGRVVERDRAARGRARYARELERLTRRLDSVLNSAGEGIYGVDADGTISFVNDAATQLLGLPRESLIGHAVDEVIWVEEDDVIPVAQPTDAAARVVVGRHHRADGTVFDSEMISTPLVEDGAVIGSVIVFRDVSERRAVDRMKDEFISIVSHELRTPLTSIRGALGLLAAGSVGELPERACRMVGVATTSTDRLIRLINDILDVERMAAGKLTLDLSPVPAADVVATAVDEMAALAESSGVDLRVAATPGVVWADQDRVVQTLTNLIGNAVKFSPPDSAVEIETTLDNGHVRFDVHDEGPGIAPDQLVSVFERFRQADASDTRQKGGTGLGLAICHGLVEAHGGQIWVTSTVGGGTTFSFTLPRTSAEHEEARA